MNKFTIDHSFESITHDELSIDVHIHDFFNSKTSTGFIAAIDDESMWKEIKNFLSNNENQYTDVVILGMGGSSLGTKVLVASCKDINKKVRPHFIDTVDEFTVAKKLSKVDSVLSTTLFLMISKSGKTIEVLTVANKIIDLLEAKKLPLNKHVLTITSDNKNPLHDFSNNNKIKCLYIPLEVGGRFSVFTAVGLVIVGLMGGDIDKIHKSIKEYKIHESDIKLWLEFSLTGFLKQTEATVLWAYGDRLNSLALWMQQLWAESLAKVFPSEGPINRISLPIVAKGPQDQHSLLQQFVQGKGSLNFIFLCDQSQNHVSKQTLKNHFAGVPFLDKDLTLSKVLHAEYMAIYKDLTEKGFDNLSIALDGQSLEQISAFMISFEVFIAICGQVIGINPFDQPGVESGKKKIIELLS